MKWIGQHIWSLISRFRSDVYLESLTTTTETNVLVVDSHGKVSKSTSVAGDLTSIVAGTGLSGTSLTGPTPTLNVDAAQTQITSVGTLTALTVDNINIDGDEIRATGNLTITASGNDINVDTDNFIIESATDVKPVFTLKSTTNSNKGSLIDFVSDKGAAGADSDIIGTVNFYGDNSAQEQILFGRIQSKVNTAADTDESGKMQVLVTSSNGTSDGLRNGIKLTGHGTNDTVSAEIGEGVASTTTIAGTLTIGSTAFANNSGVVQVATQGTIDHDSLANFVANEHIDWTGASAGTVHATNYTNTTYSEATGSDAGLMSTAHHDKLDGIEDNATADQTQADINGLAITTVGTIGTGAWNGSVIASDYLDSDTAHLSSAQAFLGQKTFRAGIILDGDRAVSPSDDGVAVHVDSSDITDSDTSASGTAGTFNYVNIEAPRIMASNASVTTTNASTVFIKGAPAAHTNQTITNAWALKVNGGNVDINNVTAGTWTADVIASAYLDADTAHLTTDQTFTGVKEINSRKYALPSSTVGDYKGGDIYYYGDGSTVKGKIYYIDGTNWTLADADAEASTKGLLAVALGTDPDADGMLLRGFVTLLTEVEGTEAIGSPIYLSATDSGIATITAPGSGDFVRVLGYSLHASDNQVYFNPDNTWVEVS